MEPTDLAQALRILGRHIMAAADEIEPAPEPEPAKTLEEIKAERAERHKNLRSAK